MNKGFKAVSDNYDHYTNLASFPTVGDTEKLYLAGDTNYIYSWNGSTYVATATSGAGDVSKVGTPVDNQIGVWTGDGTIEGTAGLTYDGSNFQVTGDVGATGTRITKGWFTDLEVTNAIAGSVTGNAGTVSTITGLAPDTATTQATQPNITSCENLATVGTITTGTWNGTDVAVADGGTGRSSHTAYAVLCGGTTTTAAQQSIASVGTSGQVLTSNGASALPTFQDAAGGGVTIYEATVGATGADYTTLGAAITAGKTRVLVIDDTTETGDITLPSNAVIHGIGREVVNVDMDTYKFDDNAGVNANFTIKDSKITFAYSVAGTLMDDLDNLKLENIYFDNNSTANTCKVLTLSTSTHDLYCKNITVDSPNYSACGITISSNTGNVIIDGLEIISAGSSTTTMIDISDAIVSNVSMYGTFVNSSSSSSVYFTDSIVENIVLYLDAAASIILNGRCSASNMFDEFSGGEINVYLRNGENVVSGFNLRDVGVLSIVNGDSSSVTNCRINSGTMVISTNENSLTNILIGGSLTLSGTSNVCSGLIIDGGVTVTTNNNTISACKVGSGEGGGSSTITVNAGATGTIITATRTDAAISDAGTGTVTAGNYVY